jgi:hypothetical protein
MRPTKFIIVASIIFAISYIFLQSCKHEPAIPIHNVSFHEEILPIFVSNCAMSGCHDTLSAKGDYVLDSYDGIMDGIKPGKPMQSSIFLSINGNGEEMMPPSNSLSSYQTGLIKLWIEQDAPNN